MLLPYDDAPKGAINRTPLNDNVVYIVTAHDCMFMRPFMEGIMKITLILIFNIFLNFSSGGWLSLTNPRAILTCDRTY